MSFATLKVRAWRLQDGSYLVLVLGQFAPDRWEILREHGVPTFADVEEVGRQTHLGILEMLEAQGIQAEVRVELEETAKPEEVAKA